MNLKTLFFLFFFGLIGLTTTSFAQQESVLQEEDVFQGGEYMFQLNVPYGEPFLKDSAVIGNEIVLISVNPATKDWVFKYIPDPSYIGSDGFTFEVIEFPFPPNPVIIDYVFQIEVIASVVKTSDDFFHLSSQDDVTLDVLSNDETSSSNLTVTLAQVLRGSAVVNEDNTITYTPAGEDPDYIIYTVSDEFNTISTSTIYLSQESTPTEGLTKNYKIASGNSQYIILPNADYTLDSESYSYGSVAQVNAFTYVYSSDTNISGDEEVNFTDSNDNTYHVEITIIEKYEDEGYVRDDLFYSAANTNIVFDVTLNDIDDQYVISDYSEELLHLGNGVFSFTPLPYFTGVKTFSYTADDGFSEETGTIELVFNNFKPTNYFEYNLSTPQNKPRVIEYDVPLGTEYFEIVSLPSHGSIEIFTDDESIDVGCEEGLQKVFAVYTPDTDYVGPDDLTIKYCASDNNICNNVDLAFDVVVNEQDECICVDDCVWPGDANGDGKVSVVDALSIARFVGSGGAPREDAPYGATYEGASAEDWLENQVGGKNVKHADANGDGFITVEDLDVVIDNYGDINAIISSDVLGIKNIPFLLSTTVTQIDSGELLIVYVTLGSQTYPAIDIRGVSFAVNLPADLVDSSTVEVEYLESGFLVKDAPYVSLTHQPSDGIIHTAGAKTNSIGSTGSGLIASVSFIVEEDAVGIKDNHRSSSTIIEDIIATIRATDIIIEDNRGFKYALPNASLDIIVNSGEDNDIIDNLKVYPNPSSDMVSISSDNGANLKSITIYSVDGRLIQTINDINSQEVFIDVSNFENGLYILKASGATNNFSTKFIKN